jgi:hypothetical protein
VGRVACLVAAAAFLLAGCGGEEAAPPAQETPPTEELPPPPPAPTECQEVQEVDGRYDIPDVGAVVVLWEDDVLVVESVRAGPGWTYELDEAQGDEVEVDFIRQGERLRFEVEQEDGQLRAELCPADE